MHRKHTHFAFFLLSLESTSTAVLLRCGELTDSFTGFLWKLRISRDCYKASGGAQVLASCPTLCTYQHGLEQEPRVGGSSGVCGRATLCPAGLVTGCWYV